MNNCWKCQCEIEHGVECDECASGIPNNLPTMQMPIFQIPVAEVDWNKVTDVGELKALLQEIGILVVVGSDIHRRIKRWLKDTPNES